MLLLPVSPTDLTGKLFNSKQLGKAEQKLMIHINAAGSILCVCKMFVELYNHALITFTKINARRFHIGKMHPTHSSIIRENLIQVRACT